MCPTNSNKSLLTKFWNTLLGWHWKFTEGRGGIPRLGIPCAKQHWFTWLNNWRKLCSKVRLSKDTKWRPPFFIYRSWPSFSWWTPVFTNLHPLSFSIFLHKCELSPRVELPPFYGPHIPPRVKYLLFSLILMPPISKLPPMFEFQNCAMLSTTHKILVDLLKWKKKLKLGTLQSSLPKIACP